MKRKKMIPLIDEEIISHLHQVKFHISKTEFLVTSNNHRKVKDYCH